MGVDASFEVGVKILGLRFSVEECTLVDGGMLNEGEVDVLNTLAPAGFGVGVKVGAKGLSMEVDVSEPKVVFLAAAKVNPLTGGGCGGNCVAICDDCSAVVVWTTAGGGLKDGKDVEKPTVALGTSNAGTSMTR